MKKCGIKERTPLSRSVVSNPAGSLHFRGAGKRRTDDAKNKKPPNGKRVLGGFFRTFWILLFTAFSRSLWVIYERLSRSVFPFRMKIRTRSIDKERWS
jgi:hypothetical protein